MLAPHRSIASFLAAWCALLLLGGVLLPLPAAFGQVDTVDTARPDTLQRPAPDTTRPAPTDTTRRPPAPPPERTEDPLRPLPPAPPLYGQTRTDSIPGRLPQVSLETILADQAGGFLYDLGEYGWPNGWSPRGLAPHRAHLWFDGLPLDDPLTGRPRYELLPPSFLERPRTGVDAGGGAVGVHTRWRAYEPRRPITEIRYRYGNTGAIHAVEVGHSQKRRLDLFGRPGVLQLTLGFGGRKADGVYNGSRLRRERRIWGRLRYQTNDWTVEVSDRSSIYRIRAHGGAVPLPNANSFSSIYLLPVASESVRTPRNRRKTVRNDLTARVRAPLLPFLDRRTELSAQWTSHTFDYRDGAQDTTLTTTLNGGHLRLRQSLRVGGHSITGTARGSLWQVAQSDAQFDGVRGTAHVALRDSLRLGASDLLLDMGGHLTTEQMYPSARARIQHPAGPLQLNASVALTGQRGARIEDQGFEAEGVRSYVRPLDTDRGGIADRMLEGRVGARTELGPFDVRVDGFAHQIRNAVDLYAGRPEDPPPTTFTDTVTARATSSPVRRAGVTLAAGWRRHARRGLYATGRGTLLETLTADDSALQGRLARTLPDAFGHVRVGARFVLFESLTADLSARARGWSAMNSRWFHPPTGRLVVPPRQNPVPGAGAPDEVGPSGTVDVRAEVQLRSATLFFTFENVQAGTQLQSGTFVVPVYPLPPQQFRFGVFWPIFD